MLTLADIQSKTPEEIHRLVSQLLIEQDARAKQWGKQLAVKDEQLVKLEIRLTNEITRLRHQLNVLLQHRFGRKSEQLENPAQGYLFDEADLSESSLEKIETTDESITIASYERKKPGRKPLPKELPRIQEIHDLEESEKLCSCGHALTKIGEVKSEQLEFIPAQVHVIEHIRLKYACKQCEETIKLAAMPKQPIPKSIATPGLLSHILVSKFMDHLPFYRQEHILQRMGIDIERATLCHWAQKCGELLKPLINQMHDEMRGYDIGYADETVLQVLKEPNRPASSKSYMWLFIGGDPKKRSFIYEYHPSRGHEVADTFWKGFKGYLHTDGYSAYQVLFKNPTNSITGITGVHCWAHARRKYIEITKTTRKEGLAHWAVKHIAKLYQLEAWYKDKGLKPEEIYQARQKKPKLLLAQFKIWLDEQIRNVPPQSPIGKAMSYCLKYWDNLMRYLEDGRLEIDNNRTERSIKPFVMGRKAWLFHDSVKGAHAGAVIYSLIETCKDHSIEPYAYLKYVLTQIPYCQHPEEYEKLLPFNIDRNLLRKQWQVEK